MFRLRPKSDPVTPVPLWLLHPSRECCRSQSTTVSHSTSPHCTTLPAQHCRSSGLLCCRSDSLELATGQSPWPIAQQQQFQTIAEDESVSSLPLSTHSTVEMLCDSVLYKCVIEIDIDTDYVFNKVVWVKCVTCRTHTQYTHVLIVCWQLSHWSCMCKADCEGSTCIDSPTIERVSARWYWLAVDDVRTASWLHSRRRVCTR